MTDAYQQGFEAYERGEDVNPYDDRDAQLDEWEEGQADAHDQR